MSNIEPGQTFFKGRLFDGKQMKPFIVWDGRRNYASIPPPELAAAGHLHGRVVITQIGKAFNMNLIESILVTANCDSLIIWARDVAMYKTIVETISAKADMRLQ